MLANRNLTHSTSYTCESVRSTFVSTKTDMDIFGCHNTIDDTLDKIREKMMDRTHECDQML